VPLLAGLAVARALGEHDFALPTVLKWPNDVLAPAVSRSQVAGPVGDLVPRAGKVCGVLAQATGSVIVLGAGLNIDQSPEELPVPGATSWRLALGLASLPRGVRESWLDAYLHALAMLLEQLNHDPAAAADAYRERCDTLGQQVEVHLPGGGRSVGVATGVDDDGALVLQSPDGPLTHHAGDVVHLRGAAPAASVRP